MPVPQANLHRTPTTGRGFTIVELLVVVSIIVVLLAILTPSMETAFEQARRAKCAANLHAIGVGTLDYATSHNGHLVPCKKRNQTGYISEGAVFTDPAERTINWPAALASVGLFESTQREHTGLDGTTTYNHGPTQAWTCPGMRFPPGFFTTEGGTTRNFLLNYLYFAGVERWSNRWYTNRESSSPVRLNTSRPGWVVAADILMIVDEYSGGGWASAGNVFFTLPGHREGNTARPEGGNHLYVDGAVTWRGLAETTYLHAHAAKHVVLIAQDDKGGWTPPEEATGAYWMK